MQIKFRSKGNFNKTTKFLKRCSDPIKTSILHKYGEEGVRALASATPKDSGSTASSWSYKIKKGKNRSVLVFYNNNNQNGVPIAIILQYGHATKNGGWVSGIDYINPALKPIFDKLADDMWMEVTRS